MAPGCPTVLLVACFIVVARQDHVLDVWVLSESSLMLCYFQYCTCPLPFLGHTCFICFPVVPAVLVQYLKHNRPCGKDMTT